jgi:AraC family transcriptional regulator
MTDVDTSLLNSHEPAVSVSTTSGLSVVAAELAEAASRARSGDREATQAHIAQAISLLRKLSHSDPIESYRAPNPEAQLIRGGIPAWQMRKVVTYVEANLSRRIPVQELARLLGLSPSHFCRAFRCTFGTPPREYVLRRRIELAQELMLSTTEPLSSIAIRCGMCDQPHFTRSFHRLVGATPYTWRRARRGPATPG